jgi:hypothetical protein
MLIFNMGLGANRYLFCHQRLPISPLWMSAINCHSDYPRCKTHNPWPSIGLHFQNWRGSISRLFLIMKVAITSKKVNDIPKVRFCDVQRYIWMQPLIESPDEENQRFVPTGLATLGKTCRLLAMCMQLAPLITVGHDSRQVWNWTDVFMLFKPRPLVSYPHLLLTLVIGQWLQHLHQWISRFQVTYFRYWRYIGDCCLKVCSLIYLTWKDGRNCWRC